MASNVNLNKNRAICERILAKHHPYWSLPEHRNTMMGRPEDINAEEAIEEAFAAASGMIRTDESRYDILPAIPLSLLGVDGARRSVVEKKTTTVRGSNIDVGRMGNKIGALCITAYSVRHDRLDFFLVPHDEIAALPRRPDKADVIRVRYDRKTDTYGELEPYRIRRGFVAMARAAARIGHEEARRFAASRGS